MIVVTGATGQLGRLIVQKLLLRVPASQIGASVRDVTKAADLAAAGVRVRHGDFTDAESLRTAFEGASQILMVSSNARAYGGDNLEQHKTAIAAARASRAKRILYTSHMAVSAVSAFPPMLDHAQNEDLLRASGMAWTALRNGFYASSGLAFMGDLHSGVVATPADGKVAWTAHADLAEAAAVILADEGRYNGPTPPLTASEALNLSDLSFIASELLGKTIERKEIPDEALRVGMSGRGVPEHIIAIALGFYKGARNGEFSRVDPTLETLLGRKPATMRDLLVTKLQQ